MNRREFRRYLERKGIQKQQKEQLERSTDYIALRNVVNQTLYGQPVDIPKTLTTLEKFYIDSETFEQDYKALYAERCLHLGAALNAIRKYVDKVAPRTWVKWRNQHITFMRARKCENLMKLAKEEGVEDFTHLGITALVLLNSAIDDLYPKGQYTRRFHEFFSESRYPYREYHKSHKVKKLIAIHIFEVKAIREGIKFDITHVKSLAEYKDVLNDKLVEDLLQHQQTGSADERLKVLIMGKGKQQKLSTTYKPKSKQLTIVRTQQTLLKSLNYYKNNFHKLGELQLSEIEKLQNSLPEILENLYWQKLHYDMMQ